MSTPITPATPEITINNTAEEIRAAMTSQAVEPTPAPQPAASVVAPPAEPQPYTVTETPEGVEIRLETGSVYKGKNWQEAALAAAKGKVEADKTLHQLKTQTPAPVEVPAATPTETPEEIATRNWLIEEQAKVFGLTADEYREAVKMVFNTTKQTQEQNVTRSIDAAYMDFCQKCTDYSDSAEAANAIVDYLPPEVLNKQRLPTVDDFRRAHATALYEKRYAPSTAVNAPNTPIPPVMPGSGATVHGTEPNPWAMSKEDLKKAAGLA